MIGVGVENFAGRAVEAIVCAVLPELCAVEVWVGDAKECEGGDGNDELEKEENDDEVGGAPAAEKEGPAGRATKTGHVFVVRATVVRILTRMEASRYANSPHKSVLLKYHDCMVTTRSWKLRTCLRSAH